MNFFIARLKLRYHVLFLECVPTMNPLGASCYKYEWTKHFIMYKKPAIVKYYFLLLFLCIPDTFSQFYCNHRHLITHLSIYTFSLSRYSLWLCTLLCATMWTSLDHRTFYVVIVKWISQTQNTKWLYHCRHQHFIRI